MQDPRDSLDLLTRLAPPYARVQVALKALSSVTMRDWAGLGEETPERHAAVISQVNEVQARTVQQSSLPHLAPNHAILDILALQITIFSN